MLFKVWRTETRKLTRSAVWIPVLLTPVMAVLITVLTMHGAHPGAVHAVAAWNAVYTSVAIPYAMLLLPLSTCAIAALVCRMEHMSGGWKLIHALPVSRFSVYVAKFSIVLFMLAISQILLLAGILFDGFVLLHLPNVISWSMLGKGLIGGYLAVIPLAALQFWVASAWESFGAQFAISTILTVPGIAVSHSHTYGPLYPWSQPILAMIPHGHGILYLSLETSMTVLASGVICIAGGLWYFLRRDIA